MPSKNSPPTWYEKISNFERIIRCSSCGTSLTQYGRPEIPRGWRTAGKKADVVCPVCSDPTLRARRKAAQEQEKSFDRDKFYEAQEDEQHSWSEQRFYKTMLSLFRPDRKSDEPLRPPFYKNRPLSEEEFQECQLQYAVRELQRILSSWKGDPLRKNPDWRATRVFAEIHDLVERGYRGRAYRKLSQTPQGKVNAEKAHELWKLAGKALFAGTGETQTRLKRKLRAALRGRPTQLTRLCLKFLDVLPQKRARLSPMELFMPQRVKGQNGESVPVSLSVLEYRATRQFLWVFLRKEANYGIADQKNLACQRGSTENPKISLRDPSVTDTDLQEQGRILWKSYPYLKRWNGTDPLGVEQIKKGLQNSRMADKETALKFGKVEASTLRKTISLLRPRKPQS